MEGWYENKLLVDIVDACSSKTESFQLLIRNKNHEVQNFSRATMNFPTIRRAITCNESLQMQVTKAVSLQSTPTTCDQL